MFRGPLMALANGAGAESLPVGLLPEALALHESKLFLI